VLAYANPFMATEPRARLAAKLAEITPGDIDVFFFTNGGAEANENAIKLARLATGRHKILARYRSYHGATAGSMMLTGDPRRWASEPGMPGVVHVLDPYHGIGRGWETADQFKDKVFYGGLTYNSHPLACAAALATIKVYEDDRLIENARRLGVVMKELHADLARRHPSVGAARSIGLFGLVELVRDKA